MIFASISTVIAVFENIIAMTMEIWNIERKKAVLINIFGVIILSMPAVLGYNVLSGITPMGAGSTIMDLEDFIVSYNILPLGGLVFVLFCTRKNGWGFDKFVKEVDNGKGFNFPVWVKGYMLYILPLIVIVVYIKGYYDMFSPKGTAELIKWMIIACLFLTMVISFTLKAAKKKIK